MKKTFVFAALLATALVAHAENLKVKIPFDFSATGNKMPAGEYLIAPVANATQVFLIKGIETDVQAFVFGRMMKASPGETPKVEFDKESLVGVTSAITKFELNSTTKK